MLAVTIAIEGWMLGVTGMVGFLTCLGLAIYKDSVLTFIVGCVILTVSCIVGGNIADKSRVEKMGESWSKLYWGLKSTDSRYERQALLDAAVADATLPKITPKTFDWFSRLTDGQTDAYLTEYVTKDKVWIMTNEEYTQSEYTESDLPERLEVKMRELAFGEITPEGA